MARIAAAGNDELTVEAARHLALWMAYEDTVRVADLKLRAGRFQRVRSEVKVADAQLLDIHEFLHPRLQEICDTLPAGLGRWLVAIGRAAAAGRALHPARAASCRPARCAAT